MNKSGDLNPPAPRRPQRGGPGRTMVPASADAMVVANLDPCAPQKLNLLRALHAGGPCRRRALEPPDRGRSRRGPGRIWQAGGRAAPAHRRCREPESVLGELLTLAP